MGAAGGLDWQDGLRAGPAKGWRMISWVAMERVVERQMASDAAYRKLAAGRPLRSDAMRLTDEELLARLRSLVWISTGPRWNGFANRPSRLKRSPYRC